MSEHRLMRSSAAAAAGFFAFAAIATMLPTGVAGADVCASANGRHVYASGCVDVAGAVDYYAPPPAYYAPLPQDFDATPNTTVCVGATGRRGNVSVGGCR
jgi:hypothetical protein